MKTKMKKKHFAFFQKRVFFWQKAFGLTDWLIHVRAVENEPGEDLWGFVDMNHTSKEATISVTDSHPENAKDLDDTACHEVLHILLSALTQLGYSFYAAHMVQELEHGVIQRILNFLKEKNPRKRV